MSPCNFSFDSAIDSEATVSIQTPFFPIKDVGLPWNFDLEHLLGKKKDIYSWLANFQWWKIPTTFGKLFQWFISLTGKELALYF